MEFDFDVSSVLSGRISHLQPQDLAKLAPMRSSCLRQIIDTMGRLSAEAQGLPTIITTYSKFTSSPDQHLYVLREATPSSKNQACRVLGFLKVGVKDLFFHDQTGNWSEKLQPFCLLDFYVHETQQRKGFGLELINFMLKELPGHANLNVKPPLLASYLAFDRPSPKLIGFLKKHFRLDPPIEQNNNFVVYADFFKSNPVLCVDASAGTEKRVKHFGYTLDKTTKNNGNKLNKSENSLVRSLKNSTGNGVLAPFGLNRENSPLKRQSSLQQPHPKQPQQRVDKMSHVYGRHEYPSQDRSSKKAAPLADSNKGSHMQQPLQQLQPPLQQPLPKPSMGPGSLRPPFACHVDLQEELNSDWRSSSNKRFQRTALW